jgi:hypothetical protein
LSKDFGLHQKAAGGSIACKITALKTEYIPVGSCNGFKLFT